MAQKKAVLAALAKVVASKGPIYVIASEKPEYVKPETAAFVCNDKGCKTHFRAIAGTQPFCITCGSEDVSDVEIAADDTFEMPSDDAEMSAVQCSSCGSHNLLDGAVATAYSGNVHCVTCGEAIEYMADENTAETDDVSGDEEITDETVLEGDDDLLETEEIVSEAEGDDSEEITDVEDDVSEDAETAAEGDSEETESSEGEGAEKSEQSEEATVKLIQIANGNLGFELAGDKLTAYVGLTPVATLEKANAGEHAGMIHAPAFAQAIQHTAKQMGTERALSHYNFAMLEVNVPVPTFVKDKAEATIKTEREKIVAQAKALRDDFRQALQIAAAGLNKSFFKGKTNVIKASLFEELSALNIRKPEKVIDKVFAAHGDTYHASLLALAEDLMSKPVDVRNQIAEAIGVSNYQVAESEDDEMSEDDGEGVSVEETLESAGVRRVSHRGSVVTATISEIRAKNNGRLFGNGK